MTTNALVEIRRSKGYTQQGLADKVGVTRQQISAIETGQSLPSVPTAKAIAAVLGIGWEVFFSSDNSIISEKEASDNG